MSRGGPHNRGKALANNTSSLAAIRFAWRPSRDGELLHPYVCVALRTRDGKRQLQRSYSVNKHGRAGVLELAIAARRRAGFPVPSTSTALAALRRFLEG